MLGISVPDAIAIVVLFSGLFVAWKGAKVGEAVKKTTPPDPPMALVGSALADTLGLKANTDAINRLAAAVEAGNEQREHREQSEIHKALQRLTAVLDERDARSPRQR